MMQLPHFLGLEVTKGGSWIQTTCHWRIFVIVEDRVSLYMIICRQMGSTWPHFCKRD